MISFLNFIEKNYREIEREAVLQSRHYDPRTRILAMERLSKIFESGWRPNLANYGQIASLCQNSDPKVRLSALKIILKFANAYPDV